MSWPHSGLFSSLLFDASDTLTLLLGLMYATGARVSEVICLRWGDFDFVRGVVRIWQGKGRKDRDVMLPESFRSVTTELARLQGAKGYGTLLLSRCAR